MQTNERVVTTVDELTSRVAQRSNLSGDAVPFTPSFLQVPEASTTVPTTVTQQSGVVTVAHVRENGGKGMSEEGKLKRRNHNSKSGNRKANRDKERKEVSTISPQQHGGESGGDLEMCQEEIVKALTLVAPIYNALEGMTEDEKLLLEGYLCNSGTNNESETYDTYEDDRLFVNDDDGINSEEEVWILQQMMDADARVCEQHEE
ncbi:hypothetical protein, conserved [Trypanosoma brucei gambiense DAL972]|uniref:Uncharacterized protein n=2 Tax=Trypanosoma brucei TaxID=5691 RepID=C9ZZ33_TRYB9|nr:hypothetical protein, conserved [Trypanosoma brucei gambiense DAL972]RHW70567.1 hypothetical protein DPX39_090073400 [Trypanosoma brucei equiperdum]CBH14682.1 hypothetical protein, conserved [Trypanosoma brucei gambiense DAL972]|eukprot:XP_011776948.1 hypothetical protein, conserved [Trypanosoma brucei gambiense DAL972]